MKDAKNLAASNSKLVHKLSNIKLSKQQTYICYSLIGLNLASCTVAYIDECTIYYSHFSTYDFAKRFSSPKDADKFYNSLLNEFNKIEVGKNEILVKSEIHPQVKDMYECKQNEYGECTYYWYEFWKKPY